MWDLLEGKCIKTLSEHKASVKQICVLDENRFCSGGNDNQLCVWTHDGSLLGVIERVEYESKKNAYHL